MAADAIVLKFAGDLSALRADLANAQAAVDRSFGQMQSAAGRFSGAMKALAGTAAFGAMVAGMKSAVDAGDSLVDMSNRLGVTVETLSTLGGLAAKSGVDMEGLGRSVVKMQQALVKAGDDKGLQQTFDGLGLSVTKLRQLTPEQQLAAIGEKLAAIPDPAQRTATALAIFGKSGAEMLQVFRDNQGVLAENIGLQRDLSQISTQTAQRLGNVDDAVTDLKSNFRTFFAEVTTMAAPAMTGMVAAISAGVSAIRKQLGELAGDELGAMERRAGEMQRVITEMRAINQRAIFGSFLAPAGDIEQREQALINLNRAIISLRKTQAESKAAAPAKLTPASDLEGATNVKPGKGAGGGSSANDAIELADAQFEQLKGRIQREQELLESQKAAELAAMGQANAAQADDLKRKTDLAAQRLAIEERFNAAILGKKEELIRAEIDARQREAALTTDRGQQAKILAEVVNLEGQLAQARALAGLETDKLKASEAQRRIEAERTAGEKDQADAARLLSGTPGQEAATRAADQARINELLAAGTINAQQAGEAMARLASKAKDGTDAGHDFALVMTSAVSDSITHWQGFGNLLKSVAQDVAQLIIKLTVLKPLEQSIGSMNWGSIASGVGSLFGFAGGGVMTSAGPLPLMSYAGGGVAHTPQLARFGEGSRPEAFVPLPDGRRIPVAIQGGGGGSVVQIIDQRSGGSRQVETARGPDGKDITRVVIRDEVRSALSSGYLDKAMATNYGLRRPGVVR